MLGSFVYAAPEMLSRPQGADARADVFGLGMTALFCLHGKALTEEAFFDPKGLLDELGRPALAAVIAKAIERKAERRFADVRSFCAALQAAEDAERLASTERLLSAPLPPSTAASPTLIASRQLSPSPPPSSAVQVLAIPPRADPSSKLDAAPENRSAPQQADQSVPLPMILDS